MALAWKLLLAIVVEVLYCVSTRLWLPERAGGIELELQVSGVRLLTAGVFWWLFQDLIRSRVASVAACREPQPWVGVLIVLLAPVVAGDWALPDAQTRAVFALTSLAVAVHEEFVYRGVLQNLLEKHLGWLGAIGVSNVVFTLYHYGAWPFEPQYVLEFFFVGCFVGLLYRGTGSLLLAIGFHALYDAVWCYTPLVDAPLRWEWGTLLQLAGAVVLLVWVLRKLGSGTRTERAS